jgi:hypothetical protein
MRPPTRDGWRTVRAASETLVAGLMTRSADWLTWEPKAIDQTEGRDKERTGNREPSAAREEPTFGYVASIGTKVGAVDGERLGHVIATRPSYILIEARPGADTA